MRWLRLCAVSAAALAAAPLVVPAASATSRASARPPAVIAFVGESGLNVLHRDFETVGGRQPVYPRGLRVRLVSLPRAGSFSERRRLVARGPLGHLEPGIVYAIRGTRLLVVAAPAEQPATDLTGSQSAIVGAGGSDPTLHGTGVVDAAIGTRYGTAPEALAVVVLGETSYAWSWVAAQRWVDLASTSSYAPGGGCDGVAAVRSFTRSGRLVFSSSGNTTDAAEPLTAPNGLPEVYLVGGVDSTGRSYLPPHSDSNPWMAVGTVTRPYETGELYSFRTASYDGFTSTMPFGGTSGAAPRTAGWAADLLMQKARKVDGSELRRVLHHVAERRLPPGAAAFAVEGYGRLDRAAVTTAAAVLAGRVPEPARPDDDAAEAAVEAVRAAAFARC